MFKGLRQETVGMAERRIEHTDEVIKLGRYRLAYLFNIIHKLKFDTKLVKNRELWQFFSNFTANIKILWINYFF